MENTKKINDDVTVTGQVTPEQLQQAAKSGFKSVLNLRAPDEKGFLKDEQQQAQSVGLEYTNIPLEVDTVNDELIDQILEQIDQLPKPALIHCASGMRAGAMTLMNIAVHQGMTPQEAFETAEKLGFDCSSSPKLKQIFEEYVAKH
ncbi:protein tyrosine phosphatase family protein [Rivularia sp. UHCC 0363]|uniref:protein tyrosine phosphatase family protein n=1 Tax=Rivularia sp. UHCC 0363 TaxID=3110244 RepID=UPI002B1F09B5|nr:protein tyrosine phosphatase family protein [Rivularia sp. UHCC 0363]MEA5594107.1 protein tyrosine phosphatase family protein [Rivularia sp. UHCC 0363]